VKIKWRHRRDPIRFNLKVFDTDTKCQVSSTKQEGVYSMTPPENFEFPIAWHRQLSGKSKI
jgi:hypothetical protein